MNIQESLAKYGTIAFGIDMMRDTIGFGNAIIGLDGVFHGFSGSPPQDINTSVWIGLVPEAYKRTALDLVMHVGQRYLHEKSCPATLESFIQDLHVEILRADPRPESP